MNREYNRGTAVLDSDMLNCTVFTTLKLPSTIEYHLDLTSVHKRMNRDGQNPGIFSLEVKNSPSLIVFTGNIA